MKKSAPDFEPFRMLMTAPSAAGKSTLIKKILKNNLCNKFDEIFVIAPTLHQPLWESIKLKNKSDSATNKQFITYYDKIKQNRKDNKESLLILDDFINTELTKPSSILNTEIMRLRHYWCSIILASQLYKGVEPYIRNNVDMQVIFHTPNLNERKKMHDELGDRFIEKYDEFTEEKYNYIFVNLRKNEKDDLRYTKEISFEN